MTEELDVSAWSAEDQKAHGRLLAALLRVADNALPGNPPTLIQIGLLAPNLGDCIEAVGNLLIHAGQSDERAKAAPAPINATFDPPVSPTDEFLRLVGDTAGAGHTVECTWDMDDGCRQKALEQWMYVEPSAYSAAIVIPSDEGNHA